MQQVIPSLLADFELDILPYATILLLARIVSMTFMTMVIIRQLGLFKLPVHPHLRQYRRLLFALALGILLGNFIPTGIDIATILYETDRPATISFTSILYTFSSASTSMLSSYLIWRLYQLAANTKEITDFSEHALRQQQKDTSIL